MGQSHGHVTPGRETIRRRAVRLFGFEFKRSIGERLGLDSIRREGPLDIETVRRVKVGILHDEEGHVEHLAMQEDTRGGMQHWKPESEG